ncbi:DUF58 domain-containing protein [Mechercharimyces sp. CAU 1602]|uniref:DUF58 domain-containing protein n=1 Tax=Mechercharimyces sp. CAU 1602 TaxID=2973933 RepID=UPI0021638D74|nr:DUF58 domain-containing protein [Mechercharimyces sp. CAU 1602]MCS1351045.1 DUF58 domain-containing protein [Mechercharimyces sp. CAU 1602]
MIAVILSILLLFGGAALYSTAWLKWVPMKVNSWVEVEEAEKIEGESTVVWVVVENHSILPIPWINVSLVLPRGMSEDKKERTVFFSTHLLPRQKVRRKIAFTCYQRGVHRLTSLTVDLSDGLGWKSERLHIDTIPKITVKPRLLHTHIPLPLSDWMGEVSVKRWYNEDPARLYGIRPYQQSDAYTSIHWAASARTGEWMVKQWETTSDASITFVINGQTQTKSIAGVRLEIVDEACRLVATLCQQAQHKGLRYGILTNLMWQGRSVLHTPIGSGEQHYSQIHHLLGGVLPLPLTKGSELLYKLVSENNVAQTIFFVTSYWEEEIASHLHFLREQGHVVYVLYLYQENKPSRLPHWDGPLHFYPVESEGRKTS